MASAPMSPPNPSPPADYPPGPQDQVPKPEEVQALAAALAAALDATDDLLARARPTRHWPAPTKTASKDLYRLQYHAQRASIAVRRVDRALKMHALSIRRAARQ